MTNAYPRKSNKETREINLGRTETINLRANHRQKVLIDRAAEALGRSRSEFMLDIACREAEAVLLDRHYFLLSDEAFTAFMSLLDEPQKVNVKLKNLLHTKAPWES